ncbi:helix-turn-helix domain-containing protein [Trueperella bialowiezensis]|uniref:DNA binding domain, excisionase family n=1 Tax=Trueperella bialowiezensis TaxID=312285 RepID=A0A3S4VTA4_9ACTO|nr:helix-turn-helix domain-containing protein [Trueperella bialowiezensis]VEI13248.1 DNA binding domain, excisionase family [Trueperella bialowiezensis]
MRTRTSTTRWLSPRQVADTLNIPVNRIYEAVARKEIPHKKIGRLIRIPANYLEVGDQR